MSEAAPQDELSGEVAGQKFSLKSASLNTIATVATLILVAILAYVLWEHKLDAKAQGVSLTDAIQSMVKAQQEATQAHRETNCLIGMKEAERESKSEWCKRIAR